MEHSHGKGQYEEGSITLGGAVAMGTGVMIGAGIFALTGQIAELAGPLFPWLSSPVRSSQALAPMPTLRCPTPGHPQVASQ